MITPGATLGRCSVRKSHCAGGIGEVLLAFDAEIERQVAMKVLPAALAEASGRVAHFVREVRAASALNHPNILPVFDAGTHGDTRILVSEPVDGVTLRERNEEGSPHIAQVLDVVARAASGGAA